MERTNQDSLSYRMAIRLFDSAFAACDRLSCVEQQSLMREIGARLLQRMPKSDSATATPEPAKVTVIGIKLDVHERAGGDSASPARAGRPIADTHDV